MTSPSRAANRKIAKSKHNNKHELSASCWVGLFGWKGKITKNKDKANIDETACPRVQILTNYWYKNVTSLNDGLPSGVLMLISYS